MSGSPSTAAAASFTAAESLPSPMTGLSSTAAAEPPTVSVNGAKSAADRWSTDSADPLTYPTSAYKQRQVMNDKGPFFFLGCFSITVGMALVYYYGEAKMAGGSRALGMAALGLTQKAREVLIWYTEESLIK